MSKTLHENITNPIQYIYAWPPSYGEPNYRSSVEFFTTLKRNKPGNDVDIMKFEGSHHFHMIDPEKTSSIIIKFLKDKLEKIV